MANFKRVLSLLALISLALVASHSLMGMEECTRCYFVPVNNNICQLDCITANNVCFMGVVDDENVFEAVLSYKYYTTSTYNRCGEYGDDYNANCLNNTDWQCAIYVGFSCGDCINGTQVCMNPVYIRGCTATITGDCGYVGMAASPVTKDYTASNKR
jgi:hypothetical protein